MARRGNRRPQDHFGRRARKQGYPARSVYKLQEIDRRLAIFRAGQRVLDLGAAPGSWSLFASERVGERGRVVGIDREAIAIEPPPNVRFVQLDLTTATQEALAELGAFDVVLSDMAPRTSGTRQRDQYLSYELYMLALRTAEALLAPGGFFVGKIFQGAEFQQARAASERLLQDVRILKPDASRSESYEIFIAGKRPPTPARGKLSEPV
jgi:23S rRNA (uridine2552-2'-O)-methyltransferase